MKLILKYFFLVDISFWGRWGGVVFLDLDKYLFLWQTCFCGGVSFD